MQKVLLLCSFVLVFSSLNAEELLKKLGGEKGFSITFEQKSFYKFLKQPRVAQGSLLFSYPRNFVWEIKGENAGKVVSNGKKTWIFSPAEEKGDTPTLAIKNGRYDGIQSAIFDPKYDTASLTTKNGLKELKIKGSRQKGYLSAVLRFREEPNFSLDSIDFEDVESTKIMIRIKTFKALSETVSSDTFVFKAPKGTRMVDQ